MSHLLDVGVDELVQMDPLFDNLCSYEAHYNTYTRWAYSNIFGLKLSIMKLDTLKLASKKLQLIHQINKSSLSC